MTRTHFGSIGAGGLNWDSLPLRLFAGGNAKFWNPADIDFSRDRADWETLPTVNATRPPGCAPSSSPARRRSPRTSSRS